MFFPATWIEPFVGCSSRVSSLISVDLPDPEGPTTNTNSPLMTSTETSASASTSLYDFVTPSSLIIEERSASRKGTCLGWPDGNKRSCRRLVTNDHRNAFPPADLRYNPPAGARR